MDTPVVYFEKKRKWLIGFWYFTGLRDISFCNRKHKQQGEEIQNQSGEERTKTKEEEEKEGLQMKGLIPSGVLSFRSDFRFECFV